MSRVRREPIDVAQLRRCCLDAAGRINSIVFLRFVDELGRPVRIVLANEQAVNLMRCAS